MKVLGVIINDRLRATDHVNSLLSSCSSRLFALRVLRCRGIPTTSLQDVFRSTVLAKISTVRHGAMSLVWYLHGCRSYET